MMPLLVQRDTQNIAVAGQQPALDPIVLVSGCDDAFALSLGIMLHSVIANLGDSDHIHIYLLDGGISDANKARIARVLASRRVSVQLVWLQPDLHRIEQLPVKGWHKPVVYMRLLIAELLPADLDRAIYLDPDIVVETSLRALWEMELGDALALGVEDFYAPFAAASEALPETYQQLGLAPDTLCCNTGVMVINLPRWRDEQLGRRVLDFTRRYAQFIRWSDQDGLNAVIAGEWGVLDPRWNVQLRTLEWYQRYRIHDADERRRVQHGLLQSPFVLHYIGKTKPWSFAYRKPFGERFLHYVRTSGWFEGPAALAWSYSREIVQRVLRGLVAVKQAVQAGVRGGP
jgi:lipopolysaccharide biosynthesis glycosyltransferase